METRPFSWTSFTNHSTNLSSTRLRTHDNVSVLQLLSYKPPPLAANSSLASPQCFMGRRKEGCASVTRQDIQLSCSGLDLLCILVRVPRQPRFLAEQVLFPKSICSASQKVHSAHTSCVSCKPEHASRLKCNGDPDVISFPCRSCAVRDDL